MASHWVKDEHRAYTMTTRLNMYLRYKQFDKNNGVKL